MSDKQILEEAKKRFTDCKDWLDEIRREQQDDIRFFRGLQWSDRDIQQRANDKRPCLTINKLPTTCQQVVNSIRRNEIAIKIRPVDSVTDPYLAEIINGIIRNIKANNDTKAAFDTALEYAVISGLGYLKVRTEYVGKTMDQEFKIDRISDPLRVYFPIPLIKEADFSDAPYAFYRESMSKEQFKLTYGKKAADEISDWDNVNEMDSDWYDEDTVWIAEYYTVEEKQKTLYQLDNGEVTDTTPPETVIDELGRLLPGPQVIKTRDYTERKVKCYHLTANTVLAEYEWPGSTIPIIPVTGWEITDNGKKYYLSLIRNAKDPQKLYNYYRSMEAELVDTAAQVPFLVAAGQIEGFENQWKVINKAKMAYVEYHHKIDGEAVAPPQRGNPAAIPAAAVNAMREASDEIKAVSGIFDASLGAQGNESSGRAIIARQRQGDNATWHYQDSMTRAMSRLGKILVEVIPSIYDLPRTVRILGEDETDKVVMINQLHHDEESGEDKLYDLSVGSYDVITDIGPSYESKRIEVAENIANIMQYVPQIGQFAPDIIVRNLDLPGSMELAERLKRTVPPQILEDPNAKPNKISEADIAMIVQDLEKMQQELTLTKAQNVQLAQTIEAYRKLLADNQMAEETKREAAAVRASAQVMSARERTKQVAMETESKQTQNMINTAVKLSESRGRTSVTDIVPQPVYEAEE